MRQRRNFNKHSTSHVKNQNSISGIPLCFRYDAKRLSDSIISLLTLLAGGKVVAETLKIGLHAHPEPIDFGLEVEK